MLTATLMSWRCGSLSAQGSAIDDRPEPFDLVGRLVEEVEQALIGAKVGDEREVVYEVGEGGTATVVVTVLGALTP